MQEMVFIGANAAGLSNKTDSLLRLISVFNPGVLFIQETKARRKNKIKLCNYEFKDLCELNLIISPEDTTCGEYFLMKAEIMS